MNNNVLPGLFITGMLRSGTTLLGNLINTSSSVRILYQPCMTIFTEVKNAFLTSLEQNPERYPLEPLFGETRYTPDDFMAFLESYRPTLPDKAGGNKHYSGYLKDILPDIWFDIGGESESPILGAKEVLCEEFTPYLAQQGFKIIIVVRDPRDVITSMNYGRGNHYAGNVRPTLYNVRNWRKSVAFALHLSNLGLARFVRYEDLVRATEEQITSILSWSGLDAGGCQYTGGEDLLDDRGQRWSGNSSFGDQTGVSEGSIGRFRDMLPDDLISYIEAVCMPEMCALGYSVTGKEQPDAIKDIIATFHEPLVINHPTVPADYSTVPENILRERQRIELLVGENHDSDIRKIFIFSDVFEILREAYGEKREIVRGDVRHAF
jgi:hypothetical protein